MTSANPVRGEVPLMLAGREFLLRPGFGALVAAEAEVGSLFQLLDRAGRGEVRLSEMAALMWHCCATEISRDAFGQLLMAAGPVRLLQPYRALLAAAFDGGE